MSFRQVALASALKVQTYLKFWLGITAVGIPPSPPRPRLSACEIGVTVIRIKAENAKTNEYRIVPVHDHLVEQGFLDYVESRGIRPLFYDPKRSRGGKDVNPHYQKVGERLAEWVRDLGISDDVAPNHGWRHRFSTVALDVGMDERIQNIIQGHSPLTRRGGMAISGLRLHIGKFKNCHAMKLARRS